MGKMVLKTYDEINSSRARIRKYFLIASIPFLIVLSVFAFKVTEMYVVNSHIISLYEEANSDDKITVSDENKIVEALELVEQMESNIFVERWVTHYNYGVLLIADENYQAAVNKLKSSLQEIDHNDERVCLVVDKLSVAYEKLGDELKNNGDTVTAERKYDEGLYVISQFPQCQPPPPPSGDSGEDGTEPSPNGEEGTEGTSGNGEIGEAKQNISDTGERLDTKKQELGNEASNDGGTNGENDNVPNEAEQLGVNEIEEIREQMEESRKDKSENDSGNDNSNGQNPGGGFDKPW